MNDALTVRERQHKPWGRSVAEVIIAGAAIIGFLVSVFTGVRAFYVNDYRIDQLETNVKEARADLKQLDRDIQRLLGYAIRQGWISREDPSAQGERP